MSQEISGSREIGRAWKLKLDCDMYARLIRLIGHLNGERVNETIGDFEYVIEEVALLHRVIVPEYDLLDINFGI